MQNNFNNRRIRLKGVWESKNNDSRNREGIKRENNCKKRCEYNRKSKEIELNCINSKLYCWNKKWNKKQWLIKYKNNLTSNKMKVYKKKRKD